MGNAIRKLTGEEKTKIFHISLITVLRRVWPTVLMFRIKKIGYRSILAHVCHLSLYAYGYTCLYFSNRLLDPQTCVRNEH